MLNVYTLDDEQASIDVIDHHISNIPFLVSCGSSTDPVAGLIDLQTKPIDVLFLDIQMPKLSGIDVLKLLGGRTKVVLMSAYTQYAVDAFEHNVVDYLLKPISFDRFFKAAQRLEKYMVPNVPAPVAPPAAAPAEEDFIFVKVDVKGKYAKVNFADITYVEGLKNYLSIYLTKGRVITHMPIKELEEQLVNRGFIRVHKSYIVALSSISMVEGNQIILSDNRQVPLGETYRLPFFTMLETRMVNSQRR
ncbi:putative response regulatory protein [Fibrella aestuarina BUZ 2]|uniref:Putative response regulatory protein n=1 Tax=Fibrella aestuarina BUZ 2 TaxID=1166018 RepID=I0K5E5_9BACT|nr:LytTR family DNA-binding domain-containing protein [Fibrella aestuarina]CCG99348.1 putative response regulatory protein [Fibrella aestuarina BUZ 2]